MTFVKFEKSKGFLIMYDVLKLQFFSTQINRLSMPDDSDVELNLPNIIYLEPNHIDFLHFILGSKYS